MAKAHITLDNGTKVTVQGTPAEVAALIAQFGGGTTELHHLIRAMNDSALKHLQKLNV
jgi:hypothetical protein